MSNVTTMRAGDRMQRPAATCEWCGNSYDKAFQVVMPTSSPIADDGEAHTFDSFECAIQSLAPRCGNCGVTIVGHGMESHGSMYCSAHCARARGESGVTDRA